MCWIRFNFSYFEIWEVLDNMCKHTISQEDIRPFQGIVQHVLDTIFKNYPKNYKRKAKIAKLLLRFMYVYCINSNYRVILVRKQL